MSPDSGSLVADRAAQRERGGEGRRRGAHGDRRLGERAADTSAGARKRPVPPVIVVAVEPVEPPEATFSPLPMKSPNSWSPFAAVRVRGPEMKKVLGLVGVSTPSM